MIKSISDILPIVGITNNVVVAEDSVTAVFEIAFGEINSAHEMDAVHHAVMNAVIDAVPDDSYLNFYLVKNFTYPDISDAEKSDSDVIRYLEKITNNSIRFQQVAEYRTFLTISIPIETKSKDEGLVGVVKKFSQKKETKAQKYHFAVKELGKIEDTIKYVLKRAIFRLDSAQIVNLISLLINKKFMQTYDGMNSLFTSDIIYALPGGILGKENAYIRYGEHYHTVLTQRSRFKESVITDSPEPSQTLSFFDYKMAGYPFILHTAYKAISYQDGMSFAKRKMGMMSRRGVLAQKLAFLSKTPEGIDAEDLRDLIEMEIRDVRTIQYARFVQMSFKVHLWSTTIEGLDEMCEDVTKINSRNWSLYREREGLKSAFYSSLFPEMSKYEVNPMVLSSFWAQNFLPIDLPPKCVPDPKDTDFLRFYNDYEELVQYDPFSRKTDSWNSQIIGSTGSGKSFLMNNILIQYAAYRPQFAILDYGGEGAGSYRNFVNIQGGTYLEISLDKGDFSINPFDGALYCTRDDDNVDGFYKRKLNALLSTLELMITSKYEVVGTQGIMNPKTHRLLDRKIRDYYREGNNNGYSDDGTYDENAVDFLSIDDFAHKKLQDDKDLDVMYHALAPFIGVGLESGLYAPIFRKTQQIKSKDVVCFDMAGLDGVSDLKKVLIPVILETITRNILNGEFSRRKMIVIDEAWRDLQGGSMRDFMMDMYRTVRKLNGSIAILTQNFKDVVKSQIADALLANTSYYYFVGPIHNYAEMIEYCKVSSAKCGSREMTEYYIDVVSKSKSKRDFFLFCPFFAGRLHFNPTLEFVMIASTDPNDKMILAKHMKALGVNFVTPEVIESAREDFL